MVMYHGATFINAGITSSFLRKQHKSMDMPFTSDVFSHPPGYNAPQQVHITQGDHVGRAVIVSWVTQHQPGSSTLVYWSDNNTHQKHKATAKITTYKYYNYTSGYIHHCNINNLDFDTKYHYELGSSESRRRRFWFMTPPAVGPDVPYTFGIMGDLGQTYDSNVTLSHYEMNPVKGEAVLFVGDLSYADHYKFHDNSRWDTWGRFVERSTAYQPWIWTAGNHELDYEPNIGETKPFKPFLHRYRVPFRASGSTNPLWYSIKRASAYIIILSSYSAYGMYTPQYQWLLEEFPKVNRSETPWLIVLMHSPWYNTNTYHFMEGETMRVMFEPWFVQYKVDLVFAGHVHAYERSGYVFSSHKLCVSALSSDLRRFSSRRQTIRKRVSIVAPVSFYVACRPMMVRVSGDVAGEIDRCLSCSAMSYCLHRSSKCPETLRGRPIVRVLYERAQDLSGGDLVYAAARCRNYLSVDQCVVCFDVAFFELAKCIVGNGAYVFLDECYARYEPFNATSDYVRFCYDVSYLGKATLLQPCRMHYLFPSYMYELFHNGLCHLATGDMLRATVAAKRPLGVKSKRGYRQCNLL
ncbi:hypothetical protein E3N88_05275 [Mikania micrantha]|uniref:Purple acid phosphatase n=1 Tax=Mikania micrantha TaxID=192012 RepID=A0A5N6PNH9_9ASTR|nr:hypothetical protein E3N88_05275 [Mikania micrantha]